MIAPYELNGDDEFLWAEVCGDQIRWAFRDALGEMHQSKDCIIDKIGDHNLNLEVGVDDFELITDDDFEVIVRACYADGTYEDFTITLNYYML